ncbi:ADP-ribosylglycohydrolase family protein [Candidatus Pristimantibacillus sp. PTI5]|uniref:ADP-ribosylglycohydrolase family protein n=1 Tax=Candidatus Pristimantibacillus sp. PTI5 TaxID=3400422 RepID=UPI003B0117D1
MMKLRDGILGLCVGDALGVPVEFLSRQALQKKPLTDMVGYGTHSQPAGTWSDDSSLVFCLMESAAAFPQIDLYDLAERFVKWLEHGYWTPHGETFDVGIATAAAIGRYKQMCIRPDLAGGTQLQDNGNGSLMRILPLAYVLKEETPEDRLAVVSKVSAITHAHQISIMACAIYLELAIHLIDGLDPETSMRNMRETAAELFMEGHPAHKKCFERVLEGDLSLLKQEEVQSSGYVVHTLEASIWSLLTTGSFAEAVLRSVNLGEDTDTTGAVTGGLAGIYYGLDAIPENWLQQLARREEIEELCSRFEQAMG